jgi:hypothetical protein
MIWLVALVVPLVSVPLLVGAYGGRLAQLNGPWITKGAACHD